MRVDTVIKGVPTTIRGKTTVELIQKALQRAAANATIQNIESNRIPSTFIPYTKYYLRTYNQGKKSGTYHKELVGYLNNYLGPFFGNDPICQIRTCDIQHMLDEIQSVRYKNEDLGKATKRKILTFLSQVLDSAIEDGIIKTNPARSKT